MSDMTPTSLPDLLKADPSSYVDPNGRVFSVEGEIYRLISPEYEATARMLLKSGIAEQLQVKGLLVETDIAVNTGPELFLHHKRIQPVSYCVEWPFHLFKKAALLTMQLSMELLPNQMYLQDAHPWNLFFEGTSPVFIDFTSIVPCDEQTLWPAYQQFCRFFLFPLYLFSCKRGALCRPMLYNSLNGVSVHDFEQLAPITFKLAHPLLYLTHILPEKLAEATRHSDKLHANITNSSRHSFSKGSSQQKRRAQLFKSLMNEIETLRYDLPATRWTSYYSDEAKSLAAKQEIVGALLNRLSPSTVLDIGANTGEFSMLAARSGASVIAFEHDESCVEHLARAADQQGLKILPLVMDFTHPTPAFGWAAQQFPGAPQRFCVDLVMALALTHHLVFHQQQNFKRIVSALREYTTRWLLIEFVTMEDSYIQRWNIRFERYGWYTRANFEEALAASFTDVQCVGAVTDTRFLYLCEK
jgi:cyclopropane fatty-acyl-phospholipid synthase-like methyltransferase